MLIIFSAALLATPAGAQVINPPIGLVDPATVPTKEDVAVAKAAADAAARVAADAAAAAAAACQPMAMTPPTEVPGGTTGSGANCRLVNSANNRISRTGVFTVSAGGAILCGGSTTCLWDTPLPAGAASYPIFFTAIGASATPGVKCRVASTTNTGFTGAQCVQSALTLSVLGSSLEVAALTGTNIFALSLPATQSNR